MLGARQYENVLQNYVKVGSQNCSTELLRDMAQSLVGRIRRRVAENPRTPKDVLEKLATDDNVDVRVAVCTNPSTPAYLSYRLASDEDVNVRLGVADDINTPLELLNKLIEDSNPYVSLRAAQTKQIVLSRRNESNVGQRLMGWLSEETIPPEMRCA